MMSIYRHFSETELALLRARAARTAGVAEDETDGDFVTTLLVTLRNETYAIPITSISYVEDSIPVIPVPCVPSFVAGIANLRGHIIPVLDLAELLGIPGSSSAADILVRASNDEMTVAFRVEAVGEVAALALADLDPIPDILDAAKPEYLSGTFPNGVVLLNVDAILSDPSLEINDATE
ncbi:MAG: purine-binding chemotaxis protein CheW [Anaerolineae bacterium]|nr:purine-binding chemotaxis protein CheW [Anaerolineae bacterium]